MFKTLIILYALNFWVIECTPNPGRYSRTGWRPCLPAQGVSRPRGHASASASRPFRVCNQCTSFFAARQRPLLTIPISFPKDVISAWMLFREASNSLRLATVLPERSARTRNGCPPAAAARPIGAIPAQIWGGILRHP